MMIPVTNSEIEHWRSGLDYEGTLNLANGVKMTIDDIRRVLWTVQNAPVAPAPEADGPMTNRKYDNLMKHLKF